MTIVFESYTNDNGTYADIEQDKFEKIFKLVMYQNHGEQSVCVFRNYYRTIQDARKAMHRQYRVNFGGKGRRKI